MVLDGNAPESIARAADALAAGQLIGLPTETVYGLAADAGSDAAVRGIFAAKGRPADHPLIVVANGDSHRLHQHTALGAGKIGLRYTAVIAGHVMQHAQRQVGDRRTDLPPSMLPIGNTYRRAFQIFQCMQHNLTMPADQHRQAINHGFVRLQNFMIRLGKRTFVQQIKFAGFAG